MIPIELRGDRSPRDSLSGLRHDDRIVLETNVAGPLPALECGQLDGEGVIEVDQPRYLEGALADLTLAHQRHDQRSPQQIVSLELQSAQRREVTGIDASPPLDESSSVLRVARTDATDRTGAEGDEISIGLRGVALEAIAVDL